MSTTTMCMVRCMHNVYGLELSKVVRPKSTNISATPSYIFANTGSCITVKHTQLLLVSRFLPGSSGTRAS